MMSLNRVYYFLAILFLELFACVLLADTAKIPTATSSLLSNTDSIKEGHELLVGVRIKLPQGWETFWRTPGEVGYGIKFSWEGSKNLKQAEVLWPWPKRINSYGFIANIYQNEVLFPVKVTPKEADKPLSLSLKLDYLLCNPTACVPQAAQLSLVLPPGNATPTANAKLIANAIDALPKTGNTKELAISNLTVTQKNDKTADLRFDVRSVKEFKDPQLFIEGAKGLVFTVPEFTKLDNTHGFFVVQATKNEAVDSGESFQTLLNSPEQLTLVNQQEAITLSKTGNKTEIQTPINASPRKSQPIDTTNNNGTNNNYFIGSMLFFAFLGGLILNLMPCVFPILSIKILTLHSVKNKRTQGVFYTLGVLFSFFMIALIILSLQSLGNMVGWGFQMQSPAFLIVLIFLFTLISLNLFGFFEIPFSLNTNLKWQKTHQLLYSFGTGVLASVVTTPCSAPFMATAIGVAISQGSWPALMIFLSLGFGFALPYLLLCSLPEKWVMLPKPGTWMEKTKQLLGFPMILSVIWLLWVAGFQMSNDSIMMLLVSLCFMMLLFWLLRNMQRSTLRLIFVLVNLSLIAYPLYWIHLEMTQKLPLVKIVEYSPEQLESLVKQHQKVFVYATAAWCITCKMNEKIALDTHVVQNLFNKEGITVMKADWTNKNNAILNYLQKFNRAGVPLYIYYPTSGIPVILPQVLTPSTVVNTVKAAP